MNLFTELVLIVEAMKIVDHIAEEQHQQTLAMKKIARNTTPEQYKVDMETEFESIMADQKRQELEKPSTPWWKC